MLKPYYERDGITIYCGDCLAVMPELDTIFDMVLADPPYGVTACKWDSVIPLEPMWIQLKRLTHKHAAIVMTATQPFTTTLISSNMEMFKYTWVWIKKKATGHLNAYRMPMQITEDIVVFYDAQATYNPQIRKKDRNNIRPEVTKTRKSSCYGKHDRKGTRRIPLDMTLPDQIIVFNRSQAYQHPTQKPVALMEYFMRTYTNAGDIVLDFAMGSGTTLVAARNLGRRAVGIDTSEEYCQIAVERLRQRSFFSVADAPTAVPQTQVHQLTSRLTI